MNAISKALNFEYTINPPSDGGLWGEMVSPGVFTGVVGELQKEFADIIWANLFIIPDRFQYIDYLDPYATDYVCYMVCKVFVLLYLSTEITTEYVLWKIQLQSIAIHFRSKFLNLYLNGWLWLYHFNHKFGYGLQLQCWQ